MKNDSKSIEDIKAIRKIMEESSRFLSLSGLSGVFAGVTAIAGALVAYFFILDNGSIHYDEYFRSLSAEETFSLRWQLIADAALVLVLSVLFSLYFSIKKGKEGWKEFLDSCFQKAAYKPSYSPGYRRCFYYCTPVSEQYPADSSRVFSFFTVWPW